MKLIGFNFTKISIERMDSIKEAPKVSTSINISEINKVNSELFKSEEKPIEVKFNYNIDYKPNIAKISFEGTLILLLKPSKSKELLENWKDKKISDEFKTIAFNIILKKSNIKAIQLEDELNLPTHFQLPSLKFKEKDKK